MLPWLYGIATNVTRNKQRSDRRFAAALERVPQPRHEPTFDEVADARMDDERQMRQALALLAGLPEREQSVFTLCAWMGVVTRTQRLHSACPSARFGHAFHGRGRACGNSILASDMKTVEKQPSRRPLKP